MAQNQNIPTLEQALDDVEARFLNNLPRSELEHTERLFFQIEQAYWFYEDFKADVFSNLPHFSTLKAFATKLFSHSALLSKAGDKFQELFSDFKSYKSKIPVFGVIMLNPKMTKAVLVCDYGSKSWTFPRGKINENETEFSCAVREVHEETGFDPSPHCREEDNLVAFNDGKQIKMYVACNVPEATIFTIMTRKEISQVQFHPLDALPKTYAVVPFLEKLKRWIGKRRQRTTAQKSPFLTAVKSPGRNNASAGGAAAATATYAVAAGAPALRSKRNQAASEKSPVLHSSSPNLSSLGGTSTVQANGAAHASPSTAKRMKNLFDQRNGDTFEEEAAKGWGVNAMFAANSKITGKDYKYDGNPHQFGASHPRFVNYSSAQDAVSSRSVFGSSGSFPNFSTLSPTPTPLEHPVYSGIAAYHENNIDGDDSFRELSEQSLRGQSLLRSDQPGRVGGSSYSPTPTTTATPTTATAQNATTKNNTANKATHNKSKSNVENVHVNRGASADSDFALPNSVFQFDIGNYRTAGRHDSFDSTHSKEGKAEFSEGACRVIFPVNFKLDRGAVMQAFDRALKSC